MRGEERKKRRGRHKRKRKEKKWERTIDKTK
jgi:hypothetical protein